MARLGQAKVPTNLSVAIFADIGIFWSFEYPKEPVFPVSGEGVGIRVSRGIWAFRVDLGVSDTEDFKPRIYAGFGPLI